MQAPEYLPVALLIPPRTAQGRASDQVRQGQELRTRSAKARRCCLGNRPSAHRRVPRDEWLRPNFVRENRQFGNAFTPVDAVGCVNARTLLRKPAPPLRPTQQRVKSRLQRGWAQPPEPAVLGDSMDSPGVPDTQANRSS